MIIGDYVLFIRNEEIPLYHILSTSLAAKSENNQPIWLDEKTMYTNIECVFVFSLSIVFCHLFPKMCERKTSSHLMRVQTACMLTEDCVASNRLCVCVSSVAFFLCSFAVDALTFETRMIIVLVLLNTTLAIRVTKPIAFTSNSTMDFLWSIASTSSY